MFLVHILKIDKHEELNLDQEKVYSLEKACIAASKCSSLYTVLYNFLSFLIFESQDGKTFSWLADILEGTPERHGHDQQEHGKDDGNGRCSPVMI